FGPGAGLAVGVSLGTESLRATLVDANGWRYHSHESPPRPDQLELDPAAVLDRIAEAVSVVLDDALRDEKLLVDGALPLLGWSVAWPSPVDRDYRPVGHALAHPHWHRGQPLDQRVRRRLNVPGVPSFALNDAHAAAIAVAFRQTHQSDYLDWKHPRLAIV